MLIQDWRDADAADVEPLYDAELVRWRGALGWDLAPSWGIVEAGRRDGRVPGVIARQQGSRTVGWAYYLLHEGTLQIGGMTAASASVLRHLLERILQSSEARLARGFSCFLFPASSSLQSALERQRFELNRHLYMARQLTDADTAGPGDLPADLRLRPLTQVDPVEIVRLMARAYAGRPEARAFAPDARLEQWAHYVGQLLTTPAIGRYLPGASFAIERRGSAVPAAAVIATSLSADTAHIAQVVVDPACRRFGLARALLQAACGVARAGGHDQMTLLVAESNEPAWTLYGRIGFARAAHFLYGSRPPLSRRPLGSADARTGSGQSATAR